MNDDKNPTGYCRWFHLVELLMPSPKISSTAATPVVANTGSSAATEEFSGLSRRPSARLPVSHQLSTLSDLSASTRTRASCRDTRSCGNPFFFGGTSLDVFDAMRIASAKPDRIRDMRATAAVLDFAIKHPRFSVHSSLPSAIDAARQHIENYPELNYLASSSVTATNEAAGGNVPSESYSAQLGKGQHFVEFERSLVSLRSLNQVIDGSGDAHASLTSVQAAPKLGHGDFKTLSNRWRTLVEHYAQKGIYPADLQNAAEVSLVLGDMGKARSVRDMLADLSIQDVDHDDLYGHVMAHPEAPQRFESFRRLSPELQALVRKTASLAHFGHITHCEGGPQMFSKLKASNILNQDPDAFEFATLVHTCDVAGALGHRNTQGSITYNKATFNAIEATFDACRTLNNGDEISAYESLLRTRAGWLGLSPHSEEDRMLARLGAMMRLTTPEQGQALKEGFSNISQEDRDKALRCLSVSGAGELPRTPTYMPAVLVNLMNNRDLGDTVEERSSCAVNIGVPFISSTLETYRSMLNEGKLRVDVPLNFNPAAGTAAAAPELLRSQTARIDPETCEVTL